MSDTAGAGAVGRRLPRTEARRLARGRGRYTDDIQPLRALHVAFVRSPYAHARILGIDGAAALASPGVKRLVTGADVARVCAPWAGAADHLPGLRSPPIHPMAVEAALWQGAPVAAVVAETRALAEDAAERVEVEWRELPPVADPEAALAPGAALVHPALGDNLALETVIEAGDAARAFAEAAFVAERRLAFGRHTGVPLEPRTTIAAFDPVDSTLTVRQSHQAPWQMQDVYARHLGVPEHKIRVIAPDIGGGFGIKVNVYGDEVAVAAIAMLMGRTVKYVADRLESFVSDIHSRDQRVAGRIAVSREGDITGFEIDAVSAIGAVCGYRRVGVGEGLMVVRLGGAPYRHRNYRGRLRCVFENKVPIGMYRGVGQPIATAIAEQLVDDAAWAAGMDPVALRRRNYLTDDMYPYRTPGGVELQDMSLVRCLDDLVRAMDYESLRTEQARLRAGGVWRGVGVAAFVELTAVGPVYYGPAGARLTTGDGCTVRLEPSGKVRCVTSITDQGQGTLTGIAQIVADRLGVGMDDVAVVAGDTATAPYGGGAWASRGVTIGGEAAHAAAGALRDNVLEIAGAILQSDPAALDLADGQVCDAGTGTPRMSLAEIGEIGHFRQDTLPPGLQPQLAATRQYTLKHRPMVMANGVQASWLEVDPDTGFVTLLGHWSVEDCGRVVNPLLVDEQIRGGIVQGIGGALFEHCRYDADGQLRNGSLADYLVPMAGEMPDIQVAHVETPARGTALGTKGAGEGGAVGAGAAVLVAINDALRPLGARVDEMPATPERILHALGKIGG